MRRHPLDPVAGSAHADGVAVEPRIVGRDTELREALAVLDAGDHLVVLGEAGIGKSRLVREVARGLPSDHLVLGGGCMPLGADLPLLPVVEMLRALSRQDGGAVIRRVIDMAPSYVGQELTRVLPELGVLDHAAPPVTADPEQASAWQRERLFAGLRTAFATALSVRRLVGVIEDVHWADATTLDFLTYLMAPDASPRPSTVVTSRRGEPLPELVSGWLDSVLRLGGVGFLTLRPLSRPDMIAQFEALIEAAAGQDLAEDMWRRSQGNPFFVEQLAAQYRQSAGTTDGPIAAVPTRLNQTFSGRIRSVSPTAHRVLAALSVAGRPLSEAALQKVCALSADDVRTSLKELRGAYLLSDDVHHAGLEPRHALLSEAVIAGLLPGELTELHAAIAAEVEAETGLLAAAEAAAHWRAAGNSEAELRTTLRAAEQAERLFANAEAVRLLERAVALVETDQENPDRENPDRVDLLRRHAAALTRLGRYAEARATADRALAEMPDDVDPRVAGRLLILLGDLTGITDQDGKLALIKEAVRRLEQVPPSAELGLALRNLFVQHERQGKASVGRPWLDRALAVAEQAGDRGVIAQVLCRVASVQLSEGHVEQGLAGYAEARRAATEVKDREVLSVVSLGETDAFLKLCDLERVIAIGMADLDVFAELGPSNVWTDNIVRCNVVEAIIGLGRPAEVEPVVADPGVDAVPPSDGWPLQELLCLVDICAGRLDDAARRMTGVLTRVQTLALRVEHKRELTATRMLIALWRGEPEEAESIARQELTELAETEEHALAADLLVLLARAEADIATQPPHAKHRDIDGGSWSEHHLGRMAADPFADHPWHRSRPAQKATFIAEQARRALTNKPHLWAAATAAWAELGMPHKAAYTGWRQAEAMLADKVDPTAMQAVLAQALHAADQHKPLSAHIRNLARAARVSLDLPEPAPPRQQQAPPLGLTHRELEVLRLLMRGSTNAGIGKRLYMSPKTASVHVTSIMRKLGATNRSQAAWIARQAGIDDATGP
jgi:DNA-binding CsgD family transcriptional regulator/tetratricopeptide (TPR) repeat protein